MTVRRAMRVMAILVVCGADLRARHAGGIRRRRLDAHLRRAHSVTIARSEGDITLTVLRDGDRSQPASVTVTSSEGFEGRVSVAAGADAASITIPLPERGAVAPGGFVTFTLSAPSPGSVIGVPDTVSMSIYEDEPDPVTQPPRANRAPTTTIERTSAATIAGRARDPEGRVGRVELRLLKREGDRCRAVKPNGRLSRRGSCSTTKYTLAATGTTRWTFRPKHALPAGRYVVSARAIDLVGVADPSPAKRTFTVR